MEFYSPIEPKNNAHLYLDMTYPPDKFDWSKETQVIVKKTKVWCLPSHPLDHRHPQSNNRVSPCENLVINTLYLIQLHIFHLSRQIAHGTFSVQSLQLIDLHVPLPRPLPIHIYCWKFHILGESFYLKSAYCASSVHPLLFTIDLPVIVERQSPTYSSMQQMWSVNPLRIVACSRLYRMRNVINDLRLLPLSRNERCDLNRDSQTSYYIYINLYLLSIVIESLHAFHLFHIFTHRKIN